MMMTYELFKKQNPNVGCSDLCPVCTNPNCRFIYSEAKQDLPEGSKTLKIKINRTEDGSPGSKYFIGVIECNEFQYNTTVNKEPVKSTRKDTENKRKEVLNSLIDFYHD